MELNGAKILYTIHTNIPVLGDFKITQTLVSTWIVMALLSALAFWLGRDLKLENVSKRQAAAEFIVERLDQFVHDNMGFHFDQYIPLVGAIFALSIGCNLISVVGLWSPTADLNTEAAWAIVVFIIIMVVAVPMSMRIRGGSYTSSAPTAATSRSLASVAGSSRRTVRSERMPGPTTMGSTPVSIFTASDRERVTWGTTEEMMAPSKASGAI